jgi:hypothetical protein
MGAQPAVRASCASVRKRWAPAISLTSPAAVIGPMPVWASSCGAAVETRAVSSAIRLLIA